MTFKVAIYTRKILRQRIFLFAVAGSVGFIVDAAVVFLLTSLYVDLYLSKAIGFSFAVFFTWLFNRNITFKHGRDRSMLVEFFKYVGTNSVGAFFNNSTYVVLVLFFPYFEANPVMAVAAGSLAGMFFNYISAKKYVFNP